MKAAGHHEVHLRRTRHIELADKNRASRISTFQVTTGPNAEVIGEKFAEAQHRSIHSQIYAHGKFCNCVKNGLCPWAKA